MAGRKHEVSIHCVYAENGEDVRNILLGCFRSYIYRKIQKNLVF